MKFRPALFFGALTLVVVGYCAASGNGGGYGFAPVSIAYAQSAPLCPRIERRSGPFDPLETSSGCIVLTSVQTVEAGKLVELNEHTTELVVLEPGKVWKTLSPYRIKPGDRTAGLAAGAKLQLLQVDCGNDPDSTKFDLDFALRMTGLDNNTLTYSIPSHLYRISHGGGIDTGVNCTSVGDVVVYPNLTPVPTPTPLALDSCDGVWALVYHPDCLMCPSCPDQVAVVRHCPIELLVPLPQVTFYTAMGTCEDSVFVRISRLIEQGAYPVSADTLMRHLATRTPMPTTTPTKRPTNTPIPTVTMTRTRTPSPTATATTVPPEAIFIPFAVTQ